MCKKPEAEGGREVKDEERGLSDFGMRAGRGIRAVQEGIEE